MHTSNIVEFVKRIAIYESMITVTSGKEDFSTDFKLSVFISYIHSIGQFNHFLSFSRANKSKISQHKHD